MPVELSADDARRFERDVMTHIDVAYRMALTLTRDRDHADDLVQDATLRALRAYAALEDHRNLRSWLARVVHTTFLDRMRYEKRHPTASIDEDTYVLDDAALGVVEFDPEVFERGLDDDYAAALDELPDSWRAVVQLDDIEGMAYDEAAAVLSVPLGTIRSRLHRARHRLYQSICGRLQLGWCEEGHQKA